MRFLTLFALMAMLSLPGGVRANAELRRELAGIADDLHKLLQSQSQESIAIGQFTGPANFPSSAGPGIVQVLTEELQKLGVTVKGRAKLGIKGEYKVTEVQDEDDRTAKLLAVEIKGVVEDGFGKVLTDFSFNRKVKGEQAVVHLIGASVELPPTPTNPAPNKDRDAKLRDSYADPKAHLTDNCVRASAGSKFGMEIVVGGVVRKPIDKDGLAFVEIKRGEIYALRIVNDSDREMAVALSIDGLNMFTFSELRQPAELGNGKPNPHKGEPQYSVFIVDAGKTVQIPGWHRNNTDTDSFQVTEYAKSAAASLNHTANVGTITATFAAAWTGDPPADETPQKKGVGGDATGFGPRVEQKYVEVKRSIGAVRAAVSVRYTK